MSSLWQLKALMNKNLIIMKRNLCATLCELLFPIILMILLVLVRKLIKVEINEFNDTDIDYLRNKSSYFLSPQDVPFKFPYKFSEDLDNGMTYRFPAMNCIFNRKAIAIISSEQDYQIIQKKLSYYITDFQYIKFTNKTSLFSYIMDIKYGKKKDFPEICFGMTYLKISEKNYNISLHYFDDSVNNKLKDIPTTSIPPLDIFKNGPDMNSYDKWSFSGFLQILQILNEQILQDVTKNSAAKLNYGIMPEKYTTTYKDELGQFIGPILSFFLVIAYLCPLCILVFRMVQEKESRAKEGMKIMGLSSLTYFLSFLLNWIILNTIYSLINAYILTYVMKYVEFIYIFLILWLYGMTIFAFSYLLQATMSKTRVAIIVTVLLYFTMYFISAAVLQQEISNGSKIFLSIMPPSCLGFGLFTMSKFDSNQVQFGSEQLNVFYINYSVMDMYVMLIIDIFIYIFVGYYLENVLPQQFGLKKPLNFLCKKNFWFKNKKEKVQKKTADKLSFDNPQNLSDDGMKKNLMENLLEKKEENFYSEEKSFSNHENSKQDLISELKPTIPNNIQAEELSINFLDNKTLRNSSSIKRNKSEFQKFSNFQSEQNYLDKISSGECLQIKNLNKKFDDGKIAVDDLTLNIYQNEIFALLGHNGAGKSTTISILTGLYEATSGEALYDGNNILEEDEMLEFRKKLGICPQNDVLFDNLTVREHLEMFSVFKGIETNKIQNEVNKILSELYLENKENSLAKYLSGGEKRKLSIAIALIGGSKIVFLDEPSSGMDITSRRNLWEILKKCVNDRIIVLTTHYMEEAAVLGNRIGIMSNGQIKCSGNSLFLIDRFGKYISLNIFKKNDANDEEILEFVKKTLINKIKSFENEEIFSQIEFEVLSEEILVRIPKTIDFNFKAFFEEFDKNLENLNIKTYEASMPSLEDVFLNVTAETHSNAPKIAGEEKKIYNTELVDIEIQKYKGNLFFEQFKALFNKRLINLIRDKKSFFLEIVCPFILVLVGLYISSIQFFKDAPSLDNSLSSLPGIENVITAKNVLNTGKSLEDFFLYSKHENETIELYDNKINSTIASNLVDFNNFLYQKLNSTNLEKNSKVNNFGSYIFLKMDNQNKDFEFVTFLNTQARYSPVIFAQNMLSRIISFSAGTDIIINSSTEPLPFTNEVKNQGNARNVSNLVFFVSIAFALIPANFITIFIKEREFNTKHLQILSGVGKFNYWFTNFTFELLKYYGVAGLVSITIWAYDLYKPYFWALYLLYGPSMILFTYVLSFIFQSESSGQNGVILLNFLLGSLAGNVLLILRLIPSLKGTAKTIPNYFRIIPSFSLTYGYSELLLKDLLFIFDDNLDNKYSIISLEYMGMDCLFMGICTVVSLLLIIVIESNIFNNFSFIFKKKKINTENFINIERQIITTPKLENEINEKIKTEDLENEQNIENQFSIQVKNLQKNYSIGGFLGINSNEFKAINNLSFNLRFGECFALLGVTGAGKTSTFKCLTGEINPNEGEIYINGIKLTNNLSQLNNLIGYCPQRDAIFDYMTVYENLDFYARIKGLLESKENLINNLIDEMNLTNYRNKISGNLSGGNKRKLSVAISMIGNPPIILLDEPSTGMDPEARRFMWAVIYKISRRNKNSSVILTTHSMEEAETLCRRIGIMVDGEFKCLDTNQALKDRYGDSFELSYIIRNIHKSNLESIYFEAYAKKDDGQLDDLIFLEDAIRNLENMKKSQIYKKIFKNFIFNEFEFDNNKVESQEKISISNKSFCSYVYYIQNILILIGKVLEYFDGVSIIYIYENNIKLKLPKNVSKKDPTIGFLLGLIENTKKELNISEFSITQTSLEQIFNKFASEKERVLNTQVEKEILITRKDLE